MANQASSLDPLPSFVLNPTDKSKDVDATISEARGERAQGGVPLRHKNADLASIPHGQGHSALRHSSSTLHLLVAA